MDPDALKIAKDLNRKFGNGTVFKASDMIANGHRFTTGCLSFDMALGGGWPGNQWSEIVGDSSNGKTAITLKTIAANQALDPDFTTVWVAAEPWSASHAAMCGVDPDRVLLVETNIMEEAYDAAIAYAASRAVDCVVIDSLPALVPAPEDEKDMEAMTVGRGALITNKFFRKVGAATKRSLIEQERPFLGLMINQFRSKIGVMYGPDKTTPGGQGKDYAYYVRAEVKRDGWIEVGTGEAKSRIGIPIKMRTIKNKSAPPQRTGFAEFYFAAGGEVAPGDYDFAKDIINVALMHGVIEKRGAHYQYGEKKWHGVASVLEEVRQDRTLYEQLDTEVRRLVFPVSPVFNEQDT